MLLARLPLSFNALIAPTISETTAMIDEAYFGPEN
jgi:hypothetical protein